MAFSFQLEFDSGSVMGTIRSKSEKALDRVGARIRAKAYDNAKTATATQSGKTYVAWRTGFMAGTIGYAVKGADSGFGPFRMMHGGTEFFQATPGVAGMPALLVGAAARYSFYVEMGTYLVPPRPFLKPAIDAELGPAAEQEFREEFQ